MRIAACAWSVVLPLLACGLFASACSLQDGSESPSEATAFEDPLSQPSSDALRFEADRVRQNGDLEVSVKVRNLGPSKVVGIRAKIDNGSWTDINGQYSSTIDATWERWTIAANPGNWTRIEYAVFYQDRNGSKTYWDNNNSHNYEIVKDAAVHRVGDSLTESSLTIDLEVKNLSYDKQCSASITSDGWVSYSYLNANYAGSSERAGYEKWRIEIKKDGSQQFGFTWKPATFEYAVVCQMAGSQNWDSNHSSNFKMYRVDPATLAWQGGFDGATQATMAADGSAFVVSGGRWVSGFAPDGSHLFAAAAPLDISSAVYLDRSNLLVLKMNSNTGPQWAAMNKTGFIPWITSANFTELVRGIDGDYLIGADGGALIGASAPIPFAPKGGCNVSIDPQTNLSAWPVVSRKGLFFCLDSQGTISSFDLKTGKPGKSFTGGWPFAAADDGSLVVVSADRSSLAGYDSKGVATWTKKSLYVAVDAQYGSGTACSNHAAGNTSILLHQHPAGSASGTEAPYIAGIDVVTGKETFRTQPSGYSSSPCAGPDGAFYGRPGYEHYGRTMFRISQSGTVSSINLGLNGQLFAIQPDGRALRRDWAYYPSDKGRISLTDADNGELFNIPFFSGSPSSYVAASNGNHLLVAEAGKISHYLLQK